jgi:tetratricopeptide (TPR) repeat protein
MPGHWRADSGLVTVDVVGFSHRDRSESIQVLIRATLYGMLERAFQDCDIAWDGCYVEDRGDGAIIVVPAPVPLPALVHSVVENLRAELRRYNQVAADKAVIRLRVSVHLGEVGVDDHGLVGIAVIHVFRLLDAKIFKDMLARSGAELAVIVSERVHTDAISNGRHPIDPADYFRVVVQVKETVAPAWIRVPGLRPTADAGRLGFAAPTTPSAADTSLGIDPLVREIVGLTTQRATPFQLPAGIDDFTGRADMVALIHGRLTSRDNEQDQALILTALSGKGGVGKTTLAVHAAHRLTKDFPDGQLYVNLRGMEAEKLDPREVLTEFLLGLGIPAPAIPEAVDARAGLYRSTLADRHVLVVLDNAADERQVRPLLPGTPQCRVLITSRAPLAGLEAATTLSVDVLSHEHAIELLGKIVGTSRIAAEAHAADRVAQLCGHLPLALRICGAKLAARPHRRISELARQLQAEHTRLDVLRAGDLEVRASFSLSYDSLDESLRGAFRLLSLLNVPDFTAWTVAPLLGLSVADAEELLDQLVEAQLIESRVRDSTDSVRFRYHDLLRVFARERLTGEESASRRAAVLRAGLLGYAQLARWADARLSPISQRPSLERTPGAPMIEVPPYAPLDWFESERNCLTTIIEQAYNDEHWDIVVMIANRATTFLELRAHWGDVRRCGELALHAARHLGDRLGQAAALLDLGIGHRYEEHWDLAVTTFEESLRIARDIADPRYQAYAWLHCGDVYREQNRWSEATACFDQCLPIFRELNDRHGQAHTLRSMGAIYREQSRGQEAMTCFETAVELFRAIGDRRGEGHALRSMGTVLKQQGELRRSLDCLTTSLPIFHELGDPHWEAYVLREIGTVYSDTGRIELAIKCLSSAIEVFERIDDPLCGAQALRNLGDAYLSQGSLDQATQQLERALQTFERLSVLRAQAQVQLSLGSIANLRGRTSKAEELLTTSIQLFEQIGDQTSAEHARRELHAQPKTTET